MVYPIVAFYIPPNWKRVMFIEYQSFFLIERVHVRMNRGPHALKGGSMKGVLTFLLILAVPLLAVATPYTQIGYETYETPNWVENYVDWTRTSDGGVAALYYAYEWNSYYYPGIFGFQLFNATGEMRLEWTDDFVGSDDWPDAICEMQDGSFAMFFCEWSTESVDVRLVDPTGNELDPMTIDLGFAPRDLHVYPIPLAAGGGLMLAVNPSVGDYWHLVRVSSDFNVVYDVSTALDDGKRLIMHLLGDGVLGMFGYNDGPCLYKANFADGSPVGFNRFAAADYSNIHLAERLTPSLFAMVYSSNSVNFILKLVRANGNPVATLELNGIDDVAGVFLNGEGGVFVLGDQRTDPALTWATVLQSYDNQGTRLWTQYVDLGLELPNQEQWSNSVRPLDAWKLPNGQLLVAELREYLPPDPAMVWPMERDIAFHRMGVDNDLSAVIDLQLQSERASGSRGQVREIPLKIWHQSDSPVNVDVWFDWSWTMEDPNDPYALPWYVHNTEPAQSVTLLPGEVYYDPEFEYVIPDLPDNARYNDVAIRYNVGHYPDVIWSSDYFTSYISGNEPAGNTEAAVHANELPDAYELASVYPNPFNPTTTVGVTLPQTAELSVTVHDVLGRQVAQLAQGQFRAGAHRFVFDGSNLASGVYFVHATVPGELNAVQKMVLMK